MKSKHKAVAVLSAVVIVAGTATANSVFSKPEYILPTSSAVSIKPLIYTGDTMNGVTVRGIPDGMGALKNDDGSMTLLSVHEVPSTGAVGELAKAAGAGKEILGTSITKFTLNSNNRITSAAEFIKSWSFYNYTTGAYQSSPTGAAPVGTKIGHSNFISRFCSATLVQAGQLAFREGGTTYGYEGAVFLTGEEDSYSGNGRGFAFDMDGNGVNLPRVGLAAWENLMPNLKPGKNTVVMANEDGGATDSQLFMYVGTKTNSGTFADKAGLTNGDLFVMAIPEIANDNAFRTKYGKNKAVSVNFNKTVWDADLITQGLDHAAKGTEMTRIEDGNWDPTNPNVFYFVTTESNKDAGATKVNPTEPDFARDGGGLWRLNFVDGQKPELGAKLELLLDGSEEPFLSKPDNMTITSEGVVIIQEDPGNNGHVARIVAFRPIDGKIGVLAEFNKGHFAPGAANFMTQDEESSGIIDVTNQVAKKGDNKSYFYFNAQIHTVGATTARPDMTTKSKAGNLKFDRETLEGGAYYLMTVSDWKIVFGS